jgi:two-component system sensor histidine kinase GlrK
MMTLRAQLAISHTVLACTLAVALALVMVSHGRIYRLLGDVRERELAVLDEEETLYRAAWQVELAARQAGAACERGDDSAAPMRLLEAVTERLGGVLGEHLPGRFGDGKHGSGQLWVVASGYRDFARRILSASDRCVALRAPATAHERTKLDEEMTEAWIVRSYELHHAIRVTEEDARTSGRNALWTGFSLLAVALAIAVALARWLSVVVGSPLARLAAGAQRIGHGDFRPLPPPTGPKEVVELGEALDGMRERLAQLDALKAGFLASVTHELRTPLAQLREAIALLRDGATGPLSERQQTVVEIADSACEKEIRLVTSLLDLSRLRAGGPLRREKERSIDHVVREAAAEEAAAAAARGVRIEVACAGTAPLATLDEPLLVRAVANLMRNAVSVSPRGAVVRVERALDGEEAQIRISDEGPGVPPAIRDKLFEPFGAHDVPAAQRRAGVGLGLTLAREIARAHGGDVELVEAAAGGCFVLRLPLGAASATAGATMGAA